MKAVSRKEIEEWDFLEEGGDVERGRSLVMGHPVAQCIRCHLLDGVGGNLGPDLREIANRVDNSYLVESLLDPVASVATGYGLVSGTTNNGESFGGMLLEETDTILVVQSSNGDRLSFPKNELKEHAYASSMPSMKPLMSSKEIRDVVAFLASLREQ